MKILLIEDRPTRQYEFTRDFNRNIETFSILKNICGEDEFHSFKEKISNQITCFDNYSVIMIHRSALSSDERITLLNYVNEKSKTLVFFSGGISSTLLQKIGKGQLLTINSRDFYSENLVLFLENSGQDILELAFGKHWKLNLLIGVSEKMTYYCMSYVTKKPTQVVLDDLDLPQLILDTYIKLESSLVEKEQLLSINQAIQADIKKLLR
jgi:hypothetical protein